MKRKERKDIAIDTLKILTERKYKTVKGKVVDISDATYKMLSDSKLYEGHCNCNIPICIPKKGEVLINKEDVITAILSANDNYRVGCLNFASGTNPCGGFLNGSNAQEESLCRSSNLYLSLQLFKAHYERNKFQNDGTYSDEVIVSPNVSAFRDKIGNLLNSPVSVIVLSAAAPNANYIKKISLNNNLDSIDRLYTNRAEKILRLSILYEIDTLILGAWGCGVFGNDPIRSANIWKRLVEKYKYYFNQIIFAVPDEKHFQIFEKIQGN